MIRVRRKMKLVLLSLFFLFALSHAQLKTCRQTGPCSCVTEQGVIDLTPVVSTNSITRGKGDVSETERFTWSPCSPISRGRCKDAAMCKFNTTSQGVVIGTHHSARLEADPSSGLILKYSEATYNTIVHLKCVQHPGVLIRAGGHLPGVYEFLFFSKHACPKVIHGRDPLIGATGASDNITTPSSPGVVTMTSKPSDLGTITVLLTVETLATVLILLIVASGALVLMNRKLRNSTLTSRPPPYQILPMEDEYMIKL